MYDIVFRKVEQIFGSIAENCGGAESIGNRA